MIVLIIIVILTLGVSAFCSMLEAVVLSTTSVEIENLKKISKKRGEILENAIENIDETTSSILTMNTIANTFGATLAGAQCAEIFKDSSITAYGFPALLTISILFFSEILPKNIGILYRPTFQSLLVYPLSWLTTAMKPIAKVSAWVIAKITRNREKKSSLSNDEIILLAEKGEKDGLISTQERDLIANSLSLADIMVSEIMTPRTVLMALEADMRVGEVFEKHPNLNFSRIPVFSDTIDNIVGTVRRRDILTSIANDKYSEKISDLMKPPIFVPENGSALTVMRQLIKKHRQMGIVVDEFGSLTGVITLEDIFEHLLGSEIFEPDDIAVDMRELARDRKAAKK